MASFDRPRETDCVGDSLRADWETATPQEVAAPYPAELTALYERVRKVAPAVLINRITPFPGKGQQHLRLNYRQRGCQIYYDREAGAYLRRVTGEVVGHPGQLTAAALGLARELGAPYQA